MSGFSVEREIGGRTFVIETGKMAKQAAGAVTLRHGDTMVLVATSDTTPREGLDFFPLTCDYREKGFAAGKIFGGRFFKGEGRPTEKEILTMRLMDRPTRPLFPKGYHQDILITALVLSADPEIDPDVLAVVGASASLTVSPIPFLGPYGCVRVGRVDGELVLNPTHAQRDGSDVDLIVCGTEEGVTMVEAGAKEVPEDVMVDAIAFGQAANVELCAMQRELAAKAGVEKIAFDPPAPDPLVETIEGKYFDKALAAIRTPGKFPRKDAFKAVRGEAVAEYVVPEGEDGPTEKQVKKIFEGIERKVVRHCVAEGTRCDGRKLDEVRPIACEAGLLPRVHGSALFTRGETQALATTTLGTADDEQTVESLREEYQMRFLLHYRFPSFCVGEVKMPRGPSRREIGHGNLARRAIEPVLPSAESDFPYTIRLTSDVLESNGSSSMATVCGGSLALMDAGVPIKAPVAGVAMGLVMEGDGTHVLTDILGGEDHFGDMDFKVAGTAEGVTALQMDIKAPRITTEIMRKALAQAREGRIHILAEMGKVLDAPRAEINRYAPCILAIRIPADKIGKLIGPGGKTIRGLEETYGIDVNVNDEGIVQIAGPDTETAERGYAAVESLVEEAQVDKTYTGTVQSIRDFGAFVEILPGTDGLLHISEIDHGYVKNVEDHLKVGDTIEVKVVNVDDMGNIRLSRKALLPVPEGMEAEAASAGRGERPRRSEGRGRGGGGGRGGRGGSGGGRPRRG